MISIIICNGQTIVVSILPSLAQALAQARKEVERLQSEVPKRRNVASQWWPLLRGTYGGFYKHGYPNSWMVYLCLFHGLFVSWILLKWMITRGTPILGNLYIWANEWGDLTSQLTFRFFGGWKQPCKRLISWLIFKTQIMVGSEAQLI